MGTHPTTRDRLEVIRNALNAARESWGETGETMLDAGRSFVPDEPVQIFIRERGRNYDLDDRGRATETGREAERVVPRSLSAWWPRRDST
jgi:hypothetical protein